MDLSKSFHKYLPIKIAYLNVDNIERTRMSFSVHDSSNTSGVTTTGYHTKISGLEFNGVHNFVSVDVQSDGIVHFDNWVRITDGATVRSVQIGYVLGSSFYFPDTA